MSGAPCRDTWATEIEQAGGTVIGARGLPDPPAPIEPQPVGPDALTPTAMEGQRP